MISVTVLFYSSNKEIHKEFKTEDSAKKYLCSISGSNFIGFFDDGSFAVYQG